MIYMTKYFCIRVVSRVANFIILGVKQSKSLTLRLDYSMFDAAT